MKNHFEQAEAWLRSQPPAVSGAGGHKTTLRVATLLRVGFALSEPEVAALLAMYNTSCSPPWNERELQHKVVDSFKITPRFMVGFMLAPERSPIRRIVPVASSVRRIVITPAKPTPPPPVTITPPALERPAESPQPPPGRALLVPLETPFVEGERYSRAPCTEWPSRLDLYHLHSTGDTRRAGGMLIATE